MAFTWYSEAQLSGTWHIASFGIQVNSQDVANNLSNITVKLRVKERVNASSYNSNGSANFWITINDGVVASKNTFDWRSLTTTYVDQLTWTGNVGHNADGTLQIKLQAYIFTNVGAGTYAPAASWPVLPAIPRGSIIGTPTLSALEAPFTVPTTRYAGVDYLHIYCGGTAVKIIYNFQSGGTVDFTDAELQSIYNLSNSASPTLTFYLVTCTDTNYNVIIGSISSVTKVGYFSWGTAPGVITMSYLEQAFSCVAAKNVSWYYNVLRLLVNGTAVKTVENYIGGTEVYLTDEEILAAYNLLIGTTPEMSPTITLEIKTYLAANKTHYLGVNTATKAITTPGTIAMKIASIGWKNCIPYVKVAGVWKKCIAYDKISGVWKRGI